MYYILNHTLYKLNRNIREDMFYSLAHNTIYNIYFKIRYHIPIKYQYRDCVINYFQII